MRLRILRSTIAVVALTGFFLGIPLMFYTWRWLDDTARTDLQHRLQRASSEILDQEQIAGRSSPPVDSLRLLVPEGGRLVLVPPASAGGRSELTVGATGPLEAPMVESVSLGETGTLRIEQPVSQVRADQFRALTIEGIVVALSVTAGFIVAAVTASRVADPVEEVAARAQRLARGDFRADPHRHGIEELDRVLDVLDAATVEIAERLQRERQIVGEVSHQLRSRLTAIHLRLDELTLHDDPEVVAEASAALDQVERLTGAVTEMVEASRAESQPRTAIDAHAELAPLVADLAPSFDKAGRRLILRHDPDAPLTVWATATRLREATAVLVDNGLEHGHGDVTVTLGTAGAHTVLVTVADEGSSIADADAQRIFTRGYSGRGGTGVGLALARAFIEGDGGRLQLQSRRPTTFAIFLPTPDQHAAADPAPPRDPEPR